MIKIKKLFGGIDKSIKKFSRKVMSNTTVVVVSGMVAVLLMGTGGFNVESKTIPTGVGSNYEKSETNLIVDMNTVLLTQLNLEDGVKSQANILKVDSPQVVMEETTDKALLTASSASQLQSAVIYSERDYTALLNIVEAEATGEDVMGKILVANVVLNRVESTRFPDNIYDVVYQRVNGRAQFSPIDDGRMGSLNISNETYEAVERAINGEDYSNGALFFAATSYTSQNSGNWFDTSLTQVASYGNHKFYTY